MEDSYFSPKALKKQQLEENRVIVRVWTSRFNLHDRGESVGHVSIEIPKKNIYWSLWPKQADASSSSAKESEGLGIIKPISAEQLEGFTYQKDHELENRPPEKVFCFYTLEVYQIEEYYEKLLSSGIAWNLGGRLFFLNAGSCASSVWELLTAGGITKLIPLVNQSSVSSQKSLLGSSSSSFFSNQDGASSYSSEMAIGLIVKSPDFISELLKQAKLKELEDEQLTKDIRFEGETMIESSKTSCNIL